MARPRVLLIAPPYSYRIAAYLKAAKQLNISLIIASEGKYSLSSDIASGIHIDFAEPEKAFEVLVEAIKTDPVNAIFSPDDSTAELASRLAFHFSYSCNSAQSSRLSRRKDLARLALKHTEALIPKFEIIDLTFSEKHYQCLLDFPVVIKPLAMSGSRGVMRANNESEFQQCCIRLKAILDSSFIADSYEASHALVESYIDGKEYAVDALLERGKLRLITTFSKPDPLQGPFFEETYYISPSDLSAKQLEKLRQVLESCCKTYGLIQGPIHAELRLNSQGFWLIEIASRTIGGECASLIEMQTNQSLESMVLANLLGWKFDSNLNQTAVGVLMIPIPRAGRLRRVEGIDQAKKIPGIETLEISINTAYELIPLPEGNSYLGFIFARGDSPEVVEKSLREAHFCLNFVINPHISVL